MPFYGWPIILYRRTNDVPFSLEDRSEVSRNDEIVSVVVNDGEILRMLSFIMHLYSLVHRNLKNGVLENGPDECVPTSGIRNHLNTNLKVTKIYIFLNR